MCIYEGRLANLFVFGGGISVNVSVIVDCVVSSMQQQGGLLGLGGARRMTFGVMSAVYKLPFRVLWYCSVSPFALALEL